MEGYPGYAKGGFGNLAGAAEAWACRSEGDAPCIGEASAQCTARSPEGKDASSLGSSKAVLPGVGEIRMDALASGTPAGDVGPPGAWSARDDINRLFRHDFWIVANATRATFAGWHDRLIATLMLLGALAAIQSWFAYRPWAIAASTAMGAGILVGLGAGRLLAARLAFHRFDGLLAADALHARSRRRYTLAWHGIAVMVMAAVALIARPSLIPISVAGYAAGGVAAELFGRFGTSWRPASHARSGWVLGRWLQRGGTGAAAALALVLALLPVRSFGMNALMMTAGIGTVLIGLLLTKVDDGIVRFMTSIGHGPLRMVLSNAKGMLAFIAVSAPGSWLMLGFGTAVVVAGASTALLLLLVLRVLAYRLHAKRSADFLIAIVSGLLMLTAYYMPVALPLVVIAVLLRIGHRGAAKTWLLA